ncbi:hypothetical protein TorRG33x02_092830 [Trema orientale]|uniref:Uncharacterized protein n=1 Tax=Trema orientale TaxID=63057 RepID=A0A2P5FBC7_TREOI|nr:hypothetical protein TorRG33x02_092830 [Trema orientale]
MVCEEDVRWQFGDQKISGEAILSWRSSIVYGVHVAARPPECDSSVGNDEQRQARGQRGRVVCQR